MTRSCKWGNCKNTDWKSKSPGLRFIPFVKPFGRYANIERAQRWIDLCGRKKFSVKNITHDSYICAHHFPNHEDKNDLNPILNNELEPYSFLTWLQSPESYPKFVPTKGNTVEKLNKKPSSTKNNLENVKNVDKNEYNFAQVSYTNPWQVSDYNEFLYYCCPECTFRSKQIEEFEHHAIHVHLVEINEENVAKEEEKPQNLNAELNVEKEQDLSLSSYICTKLTSSQKQNQQQQHTCGYCRETFKTKSELEVHCDDIHMGPSKEEFNNWQQNGVEIKNEIIDDDQEIAEENEGTYSGDEDANNPEYFLERPKDNNNCCDTCGKSFSTANNLKRHIFTTHEGYSLKNEENFAEENYVNYTDDSHFINEDEDVTASNVEDFLDRPKDNTCTSCGKLFSNPTNLRRHIYTVHEGHKDYKCDSCERAFAQSGDLRKHKRTVHLGRRDHKCRLCGTSFSEAGSLRRHIMKFHDESNYYEDMIESGTNMEDLDNDKEIIDGDDKNNITVKTEKIVSQISETELKCHHCGKEFIERQLLIDHISETHPPKTAEEDTESPKEIKCDLCPKTFVSEKWFKIHKCLLPCHLCGKSLFNRYALNVHMKSQHYDEKPFKCTLCHRSFVNNTILKQHVKNSHGERRFKCDKCPTTFNFECEKNKHEKNVHQGIRDVVCSYCGKAFKGNSTLYVHIRIMHEDAKAFKCDQCGKKYNQILNLKDHISVVHEGKKNYSCDTCGKLFGSKKNLDGHIKYVHFKSLDFACTMCGKAFVCNQKLKRHIKGVHEGKKVS